MPSGWGRKVVEGFSVVVVRVCNCFQEWDMKTLSRSEMISRGRPFSQYQWMKKSSATHLAESDVWQGIRQMQSEEVDG